MSGTPQPGHVSELEVEDTVGGGTFTEIGGLQDMELAINRQPFDTTDKDSAGWDEFIAGQGNATISGTCVYEEDDDGQRLFVDYILSGEKPLFRFRPWGTDTSTPADQWSCSGIATSTTISSPNKDALSFPFSVQLSGKPARVAQS